MSLVTQISNLSTRIGTEFKTVRGTIGNLNNLATNAKGDLVSAINELKSAQGASINDTSLSTTSTWSSQKTSDSIAASITALLNGAPTAFDTLKEISDQLALDETAAASLTTAVSNRVRFDAAQTLTAPQQAFAQANINVYSTAQIGDVTTDFAAVFTAALV